MPSVSCFWHLPPQKDTFEYGGNLLFVKWLDYVLLLFGTAILFGGVFGFVSSKSSTSLYTSIGTDVLLTLAVIIAQRHRSLGYIFATLVTASLGTFFTLRLIDGHSMPAIPVIAMSVIVLACLAFGHFNKSNKQA